MGDIVAAARIALPLLEERYWARLQAKHRILGMAKDHVMPDGTTLIASWYPASEAELLDLRDAIATLRDLVLAPGVAK